MKGSLNILKQYLSKHSSQQLYDAWISENMVIAPITKIESDPCKGGQFILHSRSPQGAARMVGKFMDLVPNEKIVYTWHWEGSDEDTLITVTFTEQDGITHVHIGHEGFQTQESLDMHDAGWDAYFEALEKML